MRQQQPHLHKQAGGTFLGFILGLVIGLGIAVVVALMITKSPLPFVNKVGKQDRAELSPSQAADPNKPLYGNLGKDAPAPEQSKPQPKVESTPPKAEPVQAEPAQNSAAKEQTADDKWTYFLQTGAFREQADAEDARAKLALLGFESRISERPADNGVLYRVRIGPIAQAETVSKIRNKLSDNGIDTAIVRLPK